MTFIERLGLKLAKWALNRVIGTVGIVYWRLVKLRSDLVTLEMSLGKQEGYPTVPGISMMEEARQR